MVNDIRGTNLVGTESMMNTWNAPDKKSKKLLMLSPFTFGITGMMYSMKALNNVSQSKDAMSEATKYSMNTMMAVLNKGTVITPEQSVQVSVLVPLDEKPQIFAVFEDTKTHEYIGVDTGK